MSGFVLGLDGGGTQVRALLTDADGTVLGEGTGGPCSVSIVPIADALFHARQASASALSAGGISQRDVRAVCVGVAGASVETSRAAFQSGLQALFPAALVEVVPDYVVAHAGALDGGVGVLVIAGTGSIAYGENTAGERHRTGGYGYLIDDAGSGYGVGRSALAAVLRASDGTGEPTTLTARILEFLHLGTVADIVPGVYGGSIDRATIASLSRIAAQAAQEENDPVASHVLMRAGGSLAVLAHGIMQPLFPSGPFSLTVTGSLWDAGPQLTDVFLRSVRRFAPECTVVSPAAAPVVGAAARARHLIFGRH